MKYIDKKVNSAAANAIVNNLLENSWNHDETCYHGADYEGLCQSQYRDPILDLMLNEQTNICCYCLKEINNVDTTIEHIIPHKVKEDKFKDYLLVDELKDHVVFKGDFNKNINIIPPLKYPHDIAYHNLIASCDSNANCNNFRKDKPIYPFIYDPNVAMKVQYDSAGIAYSVDYFEDLEATGISTSPLLKVYRKIWQLLSTEINNPNEVTHDDIEMTILTMEGDGTFTQILSNFYGNPSKKEELLKYKWFFNYYTQNNNI